MDCRLRKRGEECRCVGRTRAECRGGGRGGFVERSVMGWWAARARQRTLVRRGVRCCLLVSLVTVFGSARRAIRVGVVERIDWSSNRWHVRDDGELQKRKCVMRVVPRSMRQLAPMYVRECEFEFELE